MGVMSCSRKNCDNIMCSIYVQSVGYMCSDCRSEFKEYLEKYGLNPKTRGEIESNLVEFMDTFKGTYGHDEENSVDDFLDEHTGMEVNSVTELARKLEAFVLDNENDDDDKDDTALKRENINKGEFIKSLIVRTIEEINNLDTINTNIEVTNEKLEDAHDSIKQYIRENM